MATRTTVNHRRRVIVLGIDGMDPKITRDLISKGHLPNFKALQEKGEFKDFETINPAQSPAVWASLGSGVKPAGHGVADFIMRRGNSYLPDLSLMKGNPRNRLGQPKNAFLPAVDPNLFFWERLRREGVTATVLRWPMTFPASGDATVLAGLGTPDCHGGLGRYTLFTTASDRSADRPELKGELCHLVKDHDDHYSGTMKGPLKSTFGGQKQTTLPVRIKADTSTATCEVSIADQSVQLELRRLSPWLHIEFALGLGTKAKVMCQLMLLELGDQITIYMTPLQMNPNTPIYPISAPSDYSKHLAEQIGTFHTLGMAEDTNALRDEVIDEELFLQLCDGVLDQAEALLWNGLENFEDGFFGFVFDTTDRIQHMFWRYLDPEHPRHGRHNQDLYHSVIRCCYQRMDRILGRIMATFDRSDDLLLAISDHGFTNYRRSIHINRWLIDHGYMVLREGHSSDAGLFASVDWTKTKAFALGFSQIFINIRGRDAQGIVEVEELDDLKKAIQQDLAKLRDPLTGESAIAAVYDAAIEFDGIAPFGPELVVGTAAGYRFSWQTALGGAPAEIMEDNDNKWSGDHCVDAKAVPGVIFSNCTIAKDKPGVLDLAPTVLHAFGIKADEWLTGKTLFAEPSDERDVH